MIEKLTCVECPRGCEISVTVEGGKAVNVEGNFCKKGKDYAVAEIIAPVRVLTSTVKTVSGILLPVKTDRPILKSEIFNVMKKINSVTAPDAIDRGGVLERNIDGLGTNLVATKTLR